MWATAGSFPAAAADFAVSGVEFAVSGYGTLGYANSNQPYIYQRFTSDSGTLQRDSVAGLQVDAKFTSQFGATVQDKVAAPTNSDSGYQASLAWAFLSYRPTNDWLFRLGRQRIPLERLEPGLCLAAQAHRRVDTLHLLRIARTAARYSANTEARASGRPPNSLRSPKTSPD